MRRPYPRRAAEGHQCGTVPGDTLVTAGPLRTLSDEIANRLSEARSPARSTRWY